MTKKLRSSCPNKSPRTFCCVDVNSASASAVHPVVALSDRALVAGCKGFAIVDIPNLGRIVPELGMLTMGLIPSRPAQDDACRYLVNRGLSSSES